MSSSPLVILITAPNDETAKVLAKGLVENHLAACVNLVPQATSIYRWENAVQEETEVLMFCKSTQSQWAPLEAWVLENHPYATPEIIALPILLGNTNYLHWIEESVTPPKA